MISLLDPRAWAAIAVALFLAALGGDIHGRAATEAKAELRETKADKAVLIEKIDGDKKLADGAQQIDNNATKETTNAQVKTDAGHAAIRSGAVRLYCPSAAPSTPDNTAIEHADEGAELLQAASERIYQIGRDADEAVRERNQCIARYNDIRDKIINP